MRTYMNAIVSFSYLMSRQDCENTERQEFGRQILSSCEQLIGLFDSFLDSAIIETGNLKTEFKVCRLNSFLDELLCEFRVILNNEPYKDVILVNDNSFSSDAEIIIDSNRVFRVIRNLFLNALENTKTGYIKIGYYLNEDKLTIYVIDSGQGYFKCKEFLNSEDLNDSLTQYNDTNSAVNITLARNLIKMLDGSAWIDCNGLTGTAIYFSIPVKVAKSPDLSVDKYFNSMIAI
jgi:signal transduction histidine kinase